MLASLASGLQPTDQFISNTLQKYLLREMKVSDAAVRGDVQYSQSNGRFVTLNKSVEDNADEDEPLPAEEGDTEKPDKGNIPKRPTRTNPVLITIHGQTMNASKAFQGSICWVLLTFNADFFADSVPRLPATSF